MSPERGVAAKIGQNSLGRAWAGTHNLFQNVQVEGVSITLFQLNVSAHGS